MMNTPRPIRRENTEGVALLLALLFVVLLAVIVTDFMYSIQVEATLVSAQSSDHQGYLAAKSGVATGMSILHADRLKDLDDSGAGGVYDGLDEPWAQKNSVSSYNEDVVNITIADEYGKINLNALIYENADGQEVEHPVLVPLLSELFMVTFGLENDPTDLILDWLDADDNERPNGAESGYYESLETPFSCKNGPMDSIEELLLLPGISPELYFGLAKEGQEELSEERRREEEEDEMTEGQRIPLFDLFTVHGHPEGKLNVNTLPLLVDIEAMIVQFYNQAWDQSFELRANGTAIETRRSDEFPAFVDEVDLQQAGLAYTLDANSAPNPPPQIFTTQSNVFRIWADGQSDEAEVRVEVYVFRDPIDNRANPEPQLLRMIDWRVVR